MYGPGILCAGRHFNKINVVRIYNAYNALWHVRLTVVAVETQQRVLDYGAACHCQQYKNSMYEIKMLLWRIYFNSNNKTHLGLDVKWPIFLSDFNQISVFRQIFIKISSIKFHGNPSSRNHTDTFVQTD